MNVREAVAQLDQLRLERRALDHFYEKLFERTEQRTHPSEETAQLDDDTRLLLKQLAAALHTERDQSRLLLHLLVDAYERLLSALGVPPRAVERAA